MTVETRTTIQLSDITEVEMECIRCHTRIIWNPHDVDNFIPFQCKKCDAPFLGRNSQEHRDLLELFSLINTYSYTENYRLRFSLGEPKETK